MCYIYICASVHVLSDLYPLNVKVYRGKRRDLAASVLFYIPIWRYVCMHYVHYWIKIWTCGRIMHFVVECRWLVSWWGCVDASAATANYNLKKGRSVLIYVG
jgi:hypothetical protein